MTQQLQRGIEAYGAARRSQVPLRALVDLYDSMFCAISHAKAFCLQSRPEDEFNSVMRATLIIQGLSANLNDGDQRTKSIAETMQKYYRTTLEQLHRAKQAKSPDAELRYASVQRQVLVMRNAWASVAGMPELSLAGSAIFSDSPAKTAE
jgi:flagellar protein FliS